MNHSMLHLSPERIASLAQDAYTCFYPLVTMDVTRMQLTDPDQQHQIARGAPNTLVHVRTFPPADFRAVVAPNFDTLYSSAWLDLSDGPALLSVPDSSDRYYLLPLLDMWTDAFAVPGKRTTGTGAAQFLIVPPGWQGERPPGTQVVRAPTPILWMIGRTQTNGPADYAAVNAFQDGIRLTRPDGSPLCTEVRPSVAPDCVDPTVEPLLAVNGLSAVDYFGYAARLLRQHPTHSTDFSVLARIRELGIEVGRDFDVHGWTVEQLAALEAGARAAGSALQATIATMAPVLNGWGMNTHTMGVYGNDYLKRAAVTLVGLGANPAEDAVYPVLVHDSTGEQIVGDRDYVQHFAAEQLPPVRAFWSTTMYDQDSFQTANVLDRFALGDRDPLTYNADGSLDLYYGPTDPGGDLTANWLPAPPGPLRIIMRLYSPEPQVLDGRWAPAPVELRGARSR